MTADLLTPTLILMAACSFAALLTARLHIPSLLGYLGVGVLLGPALLAWIVPGPALTFLSELGVALLLFMVGLEFSLSHFWLTRRTVLLAGSLQMLLVATPVGLALWWLGLPPVGSALLGAAAAMSSTALVARQLAEQDELTTRHGRTAIAVLVFQDLASVPLLALLAFWARGEAVSPLRILGEVAGVLALFVVAALVARRVLHGLLAWVARQGSEESFVLVSLSVVIAAAAAAHSTQETQRTANTLLYPSTAKWTRHFSFCVNFSGFLPFTISIPAITNMPRAAISSRPSFAASRAARNVNPPKRNPPSSSTAAAAPPESRPIVNALPRSRQMFFIFSMFYNSLFSSNASQK